MINRFSDRGIFKNDLEEYENIFRDRNVKFINQYGTPNFPVLDPEEISRLNIKKHVWKIGDRFYKLSHQYYGDPGDWWIIAQFNNKPTESHVKIGETLLIPGPVSEVISLLKG